MRIINAMFGKSLGGLEQVFADYSEALRSQGVEVLSLVQPKAEIIPALERIGAPYKTIPNFIQYDPFAVRAIRSCLKEFRADAMIAQGNRAIALGRRATKGCVPLVAVNHSINIRRTIGADAVIAINDDMRKRLVAAGQKPENVYTVFNMIKPARGFAYRQNPFANPPVIGAAGRFVAKKRFDVFLEALALLAKDGVAFKAILAGDGELAAELKAKAQALGLETLINFPGWLADKDAFYNSIDIFCFSSEHDVCPVVLLEAYLWGKPVVMTDPPGPAEIADPGKDALLVPINDPHAMKEALRKMLADEAAAHRFGLAAHEKAAAQFTMEKTAPRLVGILQEVSADARGAA